MPVVVKERVDPKPASGARANRLAVIVVLLGITIVAGLLASLLPPVPSTWAVPATSFFAP